MIVQNPKNNGAMQKAIDDLLGNPTKKGATEKIIEAEKGRKIPKNLAGPNLLSRTYWALVKADLIENALK